MYKCTLYVTKCDVTGMHDAKLVKLQVLWANPFFDYRSTGTVTRVPNFEQKIFSRKKKQDGMNHCFVEISPVSRNKKLSKVPSAEQKRYRNFVKNHSEAWIFSENTNSWNSSLLIWQQKDHLCSHLHLHVFRLWILNTYWWAICYRINKPMKMGLSKGSRCHSLESLTEGHN